LLIPKKDNDRFSVLITGLRKEDEGRYLCKVNSSVLPQEEWPVQAWQLFVNEGETPERGERRGGMVWQLRGYFGFLSLFINVLHQSTLSTHWRTLI
jgi:hypothetical protein